MLFNERDCGGASSAPFTLQPTTAPSVTDNPPGGGATASGVHAANRATGSRTSPFKGSAFICHPWFLRSIHVPDRGPLRVKGGDLRMNLHHFLLGQNKGRWDGGGQDHQYAQTDQRRILKCRCRENQPRLQDSLLPVTLFLLSQQHQKQLLQQNLISIILPAQTGADYVPRASEKGAITSTPAFMTQT